MKSKEELRKQRKLKIRKKISGTSGKPRVSIFRSNKYFYAQAIDDTKGITIFGMGDYKILKKIKDRGERIKVVAQQMAENLSKEGVTEIVFDRSGYKYHGLVKLFADTLRENKIKF